MREATTDEDEKRGYHQSRTSLLDRRRRDAADLVDIPFFADDKRRALRVSA
jgi:hypothetical protein